MMLRMLIGVALLAPVPVLAQTVQYAPSAAYTRSMAAGYKALELCGAIFNGGRTQAQAEALEMTGIYPELDGIARGLTAKVTRAAPSKGLVEVPFDATLPPRRAVWLGDAGCTIQPLGAPVPAAPGKTGFAGSMDGLRWPMGDVGANAPTPGLAFPLKYAFDGTSYGKGRTTAVVIVRKGRIVGELYAEGFDRHSSQRTFSAAKSIAGTLIGIAARDRLVTPFQPAGFWKNDLRAGITLDNLLRMASGLHTDAPGNRTDPVYIGGATVAQEGDYWLAEAQPGTRFRYANNDILLAIRTLRVALINDEARYAAYPRAELFAKLGMTRTVAERDVGGNFVLSSQVWSSARDFARLGMFWMADGVWNGHRILPAGWMKYMTTPSGPQPAAGAGYGATMWLFGPKQGLPEGSFAAQGNRGQYIMVVPSKQLVIVRRGEDAMDRQNFDIANFTADVIGALP